MSTNSRTYDFVNHSYDYRPNWTPLISVTIINFIKRQIDELCLQKKKRCHPIKLMLFQIVFVDL